MTKLREAILLLVEGNPLPPRYKDHPLSGEWKHFRDCHIEPDWLLIYKIDREDLHLVRTGRDSDLFSRSRGAPGGARRCASRRCDWSDRSRARNGVRRVPA